LYQSEDGDKNYYTPDGKSMRKAFIRDPVHFSRVSSSFNLKRLHPIHKRVMPHKGIDFVANRGTPIIASGDGKVSVARQNSSSGKYIVIRHGEQYTTKYLHLWKFARGIRVGKKIKQGQVIGYVGSTGWATAPHLHYEFLLNGVHRNPRTVKLPQAEPISVSERERFLAQTAGYVERLYSMNRPGELAQTGE
jgi:murein DD-endopeptidase MepM/ murein hydrolase activator NlpD